MSHTPEQQRPWTIDASGTCDICDKRTQTALAPCAPCALIGICIECLEDARLTLEAHIETTHAPAHERPATDPGRLPAFMCTACRYVIVTPKGWTLERMNYNDISHAIQCPNCHVTPMGERHTWTDAPPEPIGQ